LRQYGLLHEIIESRIRGKPTRGKKEFNCYTIWQMMMAMMHSNGQLRTDRDGDIEKMLKTCSTAEDY